ncbi:MAG: sulfotransferase family 2 domain-containing protein, partial [Myxococcota bacterium]
MKRRFFGHIPTTYENLPRFSIVREPRERFLSAFRMFKYGSLLENDHYAVARWPDLTITEALNVLEDPWTGHDRSIRSLRWNLKHHLVPQTHPFNCLGQADHILRFET